MKIATNVQRDAFGGITISNLALFDWLESGSDRIIGIEFTSARRNRGAEIFRKYDPTFFRHHIISGFDLLKKYPWTDVLSESRLRQRWEPLLEEARNVFREERPDIVLINGTYFAPWILATVAKEMGIPIVLRYAGVLTRESAHYAWWKRRRLKAYEQTIVNAADTILFPSTLCKTIVENEVVMKRLPHSFIIPNPATPPSVLRRNTSSVPKIAAIGRWSYIKNFQAYGALHQALLKRRWRHEAYLITSSASKIDELIPKSIKRVEPMQMEALLRFYRSINLVVVSSLFETFCNVAAEAVLCGTPVLVSEQVGFAEFLRIAGLDDMVIENFDDMSLVAKRAKQLSARKITKKEHEAMKVLLDPHRVHHLMLEIMRGTLNRKASFSAYG
jgi:glycosyltransferase involved in cell wall biosynthesis